MYKSIFLMLLVARSLFGGLLDFQTLDRAESAYQEGKYQESVASYQSLSSQDDAVHYNLGNAYYKDKKYDKAITEFQQVHQPELKAKALHNLGNAYAQSKKVDKAIAAYEEALKLSDDKDTRFNLELLKKQKKQQDKKDQKKKDQKNKKDQNKKDQNKKDQNKKNENKDQKDQKNKDQNKDQNKKDQQKKSDQKKKEDQEKKDQQKEDKKEAEKKAQEKKDKEKPKKDEKQKAEDMKAAKMQPISDMQERKYEKMLDKRGIKTLMVPLKSKGGQDEERSAW